MDFRTYFDVLGLRKDAGLEEIKLAYRTLSKKFHPDLNEGDDYAKEKFIEVQEAYRNLSFRNNRNNAVVVQNQNCFYPAQYKFGGDAHQYKRLAGSSKQPFIRTKSVASAPAMWWVVAAISVSLILIFKTGFDGSSRYASDAIPGLHFSTAAEPAKEFPAKARDQANKRKVLIQQRELPVSGYSNHTPVKTVISKDSGAGKLFSGKRNAESKKLISLEDYLSLKSHKELVSVFGADAVKKSTHTSIKGVVNKCSVLKLKSGRTIIFVWDDENKYEQLRYVKAEIGTTTEEVKTRSGRVYSREGVYLGMPLIKLQELNASPIYFYGWGMGNSGVLAANKKGLVDFTNLNVKLACQECSQRYLSAAKFSSADAIADNQNIFVSSITVAD